MTAVISLADSYKTVGKKLTGTSETTCYTVGQTGDESIGAYILGISVTDSTGSVNTAATIKATLEDGVEYTLVAGATVSTTVPLSLIGNPIIVLNVGGTIKVTGGNGHHVLISFASITRQSSAGSISR